MYNSKKIVPIKKLLDEKFTKSASHVKLYKFNL